jgi:hypothetical protein
MKHRDEIILAVIAASVCAGELAAHRLLAADRYSPAFGIYMMRDEGGKRFLAGALDYVLPAMSLGFVNGWFAHSRWSKGKTLFIATLLAVLVVLQRPLYVALFGIGPFADEWVREGSFLRYASLTSFAMTCLCVWFCSHAPWADKRQ